jgi:hypothetical protein
LFKAALIVIAPLVALAIGYVILRAMPAYDGIAQAKAGDSLQQRYQGYDVGYVEGYWRRLEGAWTSERMLLVVDLAFPLLYGGAFAMAVLFGGATLGLHAGWLLALLAPVLIVVAADWVENLLLLTQLGQFETTRKLSASWIRLASVATTLKFVFLGVSFIETLGLAFAVGVGRHG